MNIALTFQCVCKIAIIVAWLTISGPSKTGSAGTDHNLHDVHSFTRRFWKRKLSRCCRNSRNIAAARKSVTLMSRVCAGKRFGEISMSSSGRRGYDDDRSRGSREDSLGAGYLLLRSAMPCMLHYHRETNSPQGHADQVMPWWSWTSC
jgi:hypothetical protein